MQKKGPSSGKVAARCARVRVLFPKCCSQREVGALCFFSFLSFSNALCGQWRVFAAQTCQGIFLRILTARLIGYGKEKSQSLIGSEQHKVNLSRSFLGTLAGK